MTISTHGQGGGKPPSHEPIDVASEGIDALIDLFEASSLALPNRSYRLGCGKIVAA